jgi:hypothetical protein
MFTGPYALRLACTLTVCCAASAAAQISVSGRVVALEDSSPLQGAFLTINGVPVGRADASGAFSLTLFAPGRVTVLAQHMGFEPDSVELDGNSPHSIFRVFRLRRVLPQLPPITIVAPTYSDLHWVPGLELRRRLGIGRLLTDSALRQLSDDVPLATVLRRWNITIERDSRTGEEQAVAQRGPSTLSLARCALQVYLDGFAMNDVAGFDLRGVTVREFSGVEYYAGGAQTPIYFERPRRTCGALVLWSRR